jgi:hypothetical protein
MADKHDTTEKKDTSKSEESKLDDALEDSFPASDPPAQTEPLSKVGGKHKTGQTSPGA